MSLPLCATTSHHSVLKLCRNTMLSRNLIYEVRKAEIVGVASLRVKIM